jgi:uncharacterized protein YjbJ (UPF0337 family)
MGILEDAKGAIKEKIGDVTNQDDLQAEGQAQKEKGEAQTEQTSEKVQAQAAEKKAEALEEQAKNL